MRVLFTQLFEKQIQKIQDKHLAKRVEEVIIEAQNATALSEINNLKKLKGYPNAYRIRLGVHRIGIYANGSTIEFVCFMDRKEIYRYFP